jgi:hypothetical protein
MFILELSFPLHEVMYVSELRRNPFVQKETMDLAVRYTSNQLIL